MEMTAKDRKALFVLLGVAVVAVLLFVFVLHKGGSNTASPPTATGGTTAPQSQPSPATGTSEGGTGGQHGPKPSPSPTQAARDPFTPLVAETPAVPSPAPSPPVSPAPSPSPSPSP